MAEEEEEKKGGEDDGDKGEGVGLFLSNTCFRMYIYRFVRQAKEFVC